MGENIKLQIVHLSQDDPKKCTARKLARFKYADMVKHLNLISYYPILLDPYSPNVLSLNDRNHAIKHGLLVIDCSWESAESSFDKIRLIQVWEVMTDRILILFCANLPATCESIPGRAPTPAAWTFNTATLVS